MENPDSQEQATPVDHGRRIPHDNKRLGVLKVKTPWWHFFCVGPIGTAFQFIRGERHCVNTRGTIQNRKDSHPCNRNIKGRYTNYFKIGHNAFEFLFDFGQLYTEKDEKAVFHTRIVMAPASAVTLMEIMKEFLKSYRQHFGQIQKM
jgi:Protein of unknown function (DUF3467)